MLRQRSISYLSLLLIFLASLSSANSSASNNAILVVTHHLESAPLTSELVLSGTINSLRDSRLSASVNALVKTLHRDVGSSVKQGELLVELDSALASHEHQRALAQVVAAEVAVREAERLLDEARRLQAQNHIAESEVSARENATRLANARLREAQANAGISAELLERHRVLAPFDGLVSERLTDVGQWTSPGDALFNLISLDALRLDVQLPQEQLLNINHVKSVEIRPDAQPGLRLPADVDTLVPVGDSSRSFLMRIAAKTTSPALVPGASARAVIRFEFPQAAVLLPRDALLRNIDGSFSVFVVEDGKAQRRRIELGLSNKDGYLVEEGLQEGEQVVIRGNELLEDGQSVRISEPPAPTTSAGEMQ